MYKKKRSLLSQRTSKRLPAGSNSTRGSTAKANNVRQLALSKRASSVPATVNWENNPKPIVNFILNRSIVDNVQIKQLDEHITALGSEETVLGNILNILSSLGIIDERAQEVSRELKDVRINKMMAIERQRHLQTLQVAYKTITETPAIKGPFEREVRAKLSIVDEILKNPGIDSETKTFFEGFQERFGLGRLLK